MEKECYRCKIIKQASEFNWKIRGIRLASYCKDCSRMYIRNHYEKNQKYYLLKARRRFLKLKNVAIKYLGPFLKAHPCVDCGEADILVLEFDHRDRKIKSGTINSIIRNSGSLKKIKEEILKCEVRCSNCHRRKTARENESWKLKYLRLSPNG